jgi:hypothetical protein
MARLLGFIGLLQEVQRGKTNSVLNPDHKPSCLLINNSLIYDIMKQTFY